MSTTTFSPTRGVEPFAISIITWVVWLIGLFAAIVLVIAHSNHGEVWGCSGGSFDCDAVLSSPWSKLGGVPVAYLAVGFYAVFAVTNLFTRFYSSLWLSTLPLLCTIPAVVSAIFLIGIMRSQLGEYCVWCLTSHGCNIVLFILSMNRVQNRIAREKSRHKSEGLPRIGLSQLVVPGLIGLILAASTLFAFRMWSGDLRLEVTPVPGCPNPIQLAGFAADEKFPTFKGPAESKNRLVIFVCPTCKACRQVSLMMNEFADKGWRIDYRFHPLSSRCNPSVKEAPSSKASHGPSCELTELLLATTKLQSVPFDRFVDSFFDSSVTGDEPATRNRVNSLLRNEQTLDITLKSVGVAARLREDLEQGRKLEVNLVPTIFTDHGVVEGSITRDGLRSLLLNLKREGR